MRTHSSHSPTGSKRSPRAIAVVSEFLTSIVRRTFGSSNLKLPTKAVELKYSEISEKFNNSYFRSQLAMLTGSFKNTSKSLCYTNKGSSTFVSGLSLPTLLKSISTKTVIFVLPQMSIPLPRKTTMCISQTSASKTNQTITPDTKRATL